MTRRYSARSGSGVYVAGGAVTHVEGDECPREDFAVDERFPTRERHVAGGLLGRLGQAFTGTG
jgi:hypothetical protein